LIIFIVINSQSMSLYNISLDILDTRDTIVSPDYISRAYTNYLYFSISPAKAHRIRVEVI